MNWIYKNFSKNTIIHNNKICKPDEQIISPYPLPSSLGLTCIQEGRNPDPVILHEDVSLKAGETKFIDINAPELSKNIALSIMCMTQDSGVECRFNHNDNKPVPIDIRGFSQTLPWIMCSRIFLKNVTSSLAVISITAVEVIS